MSDGHGHDHAHDDETADDVRPRVRALQSLLIEKGFVSTDAIDEVIASYEHDVGPMNGARVVARAWTDPAFKRQLLEDADAALEAFDFDVGVQHIDVKENTDAVHNAVVCTLCSCYPWSLLGLPPTWYKTPAYRSRMVREPRAVLSEFGLDLDAETDVNVWDSSSEIRYMVLPQRPSGTEDLDGDELAALVTRNAMIGVERLPRTASDGGVTEPGQFGDPGASLSELTGEERPTFEAPWQARGFAVAVALYDDGAGFEWSAFQERLIDAVEATAPSAYADDAETTYYEQWCEALERLVVERDVLDTDAIDERAAEFAAGDRTAEEFVEGFRGH